MLMLLSVHVTGILFLVRFNNFTLTMGFYWSYSSHPFLCALDLHLHFHSFILHIPEYQVEQQE